MSNEAYELRKRALDAAAVKHLGQLRKGQDVIVRYGKLMVRLSGGINATDAAAMPGLRARQLKDESNRMERHFAEVWREGAGRAFFENELVSVNKGYHSARTARVCAALAQYFGTVGGMEMVGSATKALLEAPVQQGKPIAPGGRCKRFLNEYQMIFDSKTDEGWVVMTSAIGPWGYQTRRRIGGGNIELADFPSLLQPVLGGLSGELAKRWTQRNLLGGPTKAMPELEWLVGSASKADQVEAATMIVHAGNHPTLLREALARIVKDTQVAPGWRTRAKQIAEQLEAVETR